MNSDIIYVFVYSYLLGSIPFGLIITKIFLGKDIRKVGSGNIGTTNVLRTGKKSLAAATLLFDVLKGYFSILITYNYFNDLIYLSALICFIGHIFPIWLKFKGGKGVATYLGVILGISLNLGIVFGVTWIVIALIFRYSSLSSILGSMAVWIYSISFTNEMQSYFSFFLFVIIFFTHKENIIRLKNSKETKIKI
ncbi:glycerol-3-phosphate 1-O-acyltransferase PlsY [Candidatus Pelagibacter bacterium]|jgi:glycerol-3-phosphate acyltransferase PlsY|nr:glycerol-3-phosphate 1-O-acyltransferase PlsY [Candidatus Pelagibacter bacterium]MDA8772724.1 glycerol-3-phosphate 1-O-acyltransferase PlsY [Candidatus Pelagibacter bacterium]